MTAVEGNASVYQVYPVGRLTGKGRAEVLGPWGPGIVIILQGAGSGGKGGAESSIRAGKPQTP